MASHRSKRLLYRFLVWIGPYLITLLGFTLRIRRVNDQPVKDLVARRQPVLWCLWHGRMFLPIFVHRRQGVVAMISQHEDGEMIARVIKRLGYESVRGSSTRGGKEAFYGMLGLLKEGKQVVMLPDGPLGPRHQFKPGTLFLAQQSQSSLVPITFAAQPCWRFRSWDQFVLPKPFARCVVVYGDPIRVPESIPQDKVEAWRMKLEKIMVDLVNDAEAQLGQADV